MIKTKGVSHECVQVDDYLPGLHQQNSTGACGDGMAVPNAIAFAWPEHPIQFS